jgi:hypothetical protein
MTLVEEMKKNSTWASFSGEIKGSFKILKKESTMNKVILLSLASVLAFALSANANPQQNADNEKMKQEFNQKWLNAEKKAEGEPIHVAVLMPTASEQLKSFRKGYWKMVRNEFKGKENIKLVPWKKLKKSLKWVSPTSEHNKRGGVKHTSNSKKKNKYEYFATPETVEDMRFTGVPADVVVFTHLSPKSKTGLLKGSKLKKGAVATVTNVEISTTISPIFKFDKHQWTQVGKSSDGMKGASWDKKGKGQKGEFKYKRNIKGDQPAVAANVTAAYEHMKGWQTELPSVQAAKALRDEQRKVATAGLPEGVVDLLQGGGDEDKKKKKKKALKKLKGLFK